MKYGFEAVQDVFRGRPGLRKRRGWLSIFGVMVVFALLAGCHSDPNVRKQKYFESGKRYATDGKYKEAVIQYSNAVKIDKGYAEAHYELAKAYLHLRDVGAAYRELTRTVDLQPSNSKARIDLGDLLVAAGKIDDAQAQADAVMSTQPDNPDLHALLAAIAIKRGQRPEAMGQIERALQLDPGRASFHEDAAILQSADKEKLPEVESELKKSISLDPKSIRPRLLLAAFYATLGRWQEAEQTDRDAIRVDPKSLAARESLAQILLRHDDQAGAEAVLNQAAQDLADDPRGLRVLADYYVRSGQVDKAKREFAALTEKHPKDLSLKEEYARALLQARDYATAQAIIDGMMKKNSKDPQVLALHGIVLMNAGKNDEALAALQSAVKDYPKDSFLQLWLGRAALAKGDIGLAKTSFGHAAESGPSRLEAQGQLADIAIMTGDTNLLSDAADKTIALAPRFAGGYVWRAMVQASRNDLDKAEVDLKTAMQLAPQNSAAYLELGRIRLTQKHLPEAAALFEQGLQYDPNNIEAMRLLVGYDLNRKQPEKAVARLNAQIEKSPSNSGLYDLLAQVQAQEKDFDQAAATAQKAVLMNPSDGEAVMLYAQLQVRRGQTANAIAAWEKWLSNHPNDAGAHAILGTLEESRGDQPKAESYYKKSLQIQPQQALAANNLAYMMLQKGENADAALALAQTARRAMPNSTNTADTLAWAYYHKATYSFARDLLEEALKTDSNNATMQYHLGMVYSKLGDRGNAELHLKKVLALAPGTATAKDATAALQGQS